MSETSASIYESRLLLYVDVLGWRAEVARGVSSRLVEVLNRIHAQAEAYNEGVREYYLERSRAGTVRVNPIFLGVQFGAFSDHFVFSMPEDFGGRILTAATELLVDLLHIGFLTRGAVVLGDLYHRDNVIFGPALIEAYDMESKQAFYPRILISEPVIKLLGWSEADADEPLVVADKTGRKVVNPFLLPFGGGDEAMVEAFAGPNLHLAEIKRTIERNIAALEAEGRFGHAEKWRYMHQFIEVTVLDADPRLRPLWK